MQLTEKQKLEGWRIVKFGDVSQEVKASTKDPLGEGIERYIGLEHIDPESLRLARYGLIADDNPTFTKKFSAGDILFGRRRAYLKKAAVADFDGICSGDITVIAPKGEDLVPDLLPFIVQSEPFFNWAVKHSAGGLSPRTKFKSLAEFEFPLPPRPRQEEMLEVFEKIENCSFENSLLLSELKKLIRLVERKLAENGHFFRGEIKTTPSNINGISKFTSGKLKTKKDLKEKGSQFQIPVYGGNGINGYTDEVLLDTKTVIVGRVGEYCGATYFTNSPVWITDNALYTKDISEKIEPEYFYCLIKSLNLNQYKSQSGQPLINQGVLGALSVEYPDEEKQMILAKIYKQLENLEQDINKKQKSYSSLRSNILIKTLTEAA